MLALCVLRLTNGNCSAARSVGSASTKTQSAQAPLWVFVLAHFFVPVKHLVFSLSGTKKRQLPRTLSAIRNSMNNYFTTHYEIQCAVLAHTNF